MGNKKNIVFLVPDGVGVRNYLFSNIISSLKPHANIHLWTTLTRPSLKEVEKLHDVQLYYRSISLSPEPVKARLWRESSTYARLLVNRKQLDNPVVMEYWGKRPKGLKMKMFYYLVKKIGRWASRDYNRILRLEERSSRLWPASKVEHFKDILKEINPEKIFVTHQRVASLQPICAAAKELEIPVISCIYSWDNTAKASLAIRADGYLVWSDYMKEELLKLYPEIPSETVTITGTPQFEFHQQEDRLISREQFAQSYGLREERRWVCFSGDDELTSPYDPAYLDDVAEAIQSIPEAERPQIIFRRCPVDFSPRYDSILNKWKDLIIPIDPLWNTSKGNWGGIYPKPEDLNLLVNLAHHCDVVINIGSTMAHDFAMMGKPGLYIAYDQPISESWSTDVIYKFEHFRSMDGLDAVGWIRKKSDIAKQLKLAIHHPDKIATDRYKWLERIVKLPAGDASDAIVKELLS
ncbi:MAG: hypothetical protein KJO05_07625 [Bacteroidia bacterium]|nr:hypothetical protein [Bacteroidia bacterium]NNF32451.1 hypothetical protein [Flavobacteriaceae bacterium]MBT8267891.1 hypothetical protein [Bacteroidia bacterium]MBT8276139.1 hypothetical protein [Bacteroidia bacterium]NNJ81718.1 hypothetical protein [Flavobacteriaceae bacterium]